MQTKVRDEIANKGLARSQIVILDALLKLRQVCCDPRLVKLPQAKTASRLGQARTPDGDAAGAGEEGRRILLFSQFTSMLALIEAELDELEIPFVDADRRHQDRADAGPRSSRAGRCRCS